jgi:hypothetical protein
MNISIEWNSEVPKSFDKNEVEQNVKNEIENCYEDFSIQENEASVFLNYDSVNNALVGLVKSRDQFYLTVSYSLQEKHVATYKRQ